MLSGTERRYVSIWLPMWPIERFRRQQSQHPASARSGDAGQDSALVLVAPAQGGIRVMAASQQATAYGVAVGMLLADARMLYPPLRVEDYSPAHDEKALQTLSEWCLRYSPCVARDLPDGILIDISGCAHLYGGEAALLDDMVDRLSGFGLTCRIAAAPTAGAAWALARYGKAERAMASPDSMPGQLSSLPVQALRIDETTASRLCQVGLKTIGHIQDKPRAPLAARFGKALTRRLDQALGQQGEALTMLTEPPAYRTVMRFVEPVLHLDRLENHLADMIASLMKQLVQAGLGTGQLVLTLLRLDGDARSVPVGVSRITRDGDLVRRLFAEQLKSFSEDYDAGFGIETMILGAWACEPLAETQRSLEGDRAGRSRVALQTLLDRYINRLGEESVGHLVPHESYIPERSERLVPIAAGSGKTADWPLFLEQLQGSSHPGRPIALLPRPEEITAIAEVPDGPPVRFMWRRVTHHILKAEGPERIAPEWWSRPASRTEPTRDYYRVEDRDGCRYWLFRQGLFERSEPVRWYMHGLFP